MGHECALDRAGSLHPDSDALFEGGRVCRKPSCLCLPGLLGLKGEAVRVRNLALWLSQAALLAPNPAPNIRGSAPYPRQRACAPLQ